MSTNNSKNRHLSHLVSTLHEAPESAVTTGPQPPFIPEQTVAAERPPSSRSVRAATGQLHGSMVGSITLCLLIVMLGLLGYAGYRSQAALKHLEQQIAAISLPPSSAATLTAAADPTDQLTALQRQLLEIREEVSALNAALDSLPTTIGADLGEIKAALMQTDAPPPTKPVTAPTTATPPASQTFSTEQKPWFVNLATFYTRDSTAPLVKRVRQLGLTPHVTTADIGGKVGYRIQVSGLGSRGEAELLAESLEQRLKLNGLWVGQE